MYKVFALLLVIILPNSLKALVVNIDADEFKPIPIAVLNFDINKVSKRRVRAIEHIIVDDLNSSFVFKAVNGSNSLLVNKTLQEKKKDLLDNGFLFFVTGGAYKTSGNSIGIKFELHSLLEDKIILSYSYTFNKSLLKEKHRNIAHDIANEIYKDFTLQDAFFNTSIVYVEKDSIKKADFDFGRIETIYKNKNSILINPKMSPNEDKVVFLEINKKTGSSVLSIYDIKTGNIEHIKHEDDGTVLSPSFSKDGKKLLFSIAKNRSANIYELNINSKSILKITNSYSINVSASYLPNDNSEIIFTSDRHGQPQIFTLKDSQDTPNRVTSVLSGSYYTPVWSPNKKYIAFTKIANSKFFIGIMNSQTKKETILASDSYAEGPTWSSDSRQIAYQAKVNGKYMIMFVDIKTGKKKSFKTKNGISNPYWYISSKGLSGVIKRAVY